MHAVLIEVDARGQPDSQAGLKRTCGGRQVPRVSQAPGFQAGYWLRPLGDAKGTALIVFDTQEHTEAACRS